MNYLARRALSTALQLLLISFLCFGLFSLVPGDYYSGAAWSPEWSRETLQAWRDLHGLNQPWPLRYAIWLRSALHGDLGSSIAFGIPVSQLIAARAAKTLQLIVPAFLTAWTLGLLLAIALSAYARPRLLRLIETAATAGNLFPEVLLVSLLLWLALALRFPLQSIWIPIAGLSLVIAPMVFLHATMSIRTARALPFVRLAERRGIRPIPLWLHYILPAAANPLISLFGLSLGSALGASLVAEAVSGWPGLGPLLLDAVQSRDYPIVQALVLLSAVVLALSNLTADLILYWHDPRIRTHHETTP